MQSIRFRRRSCRAVVPVLVVASALCTTMAADKNPAEEAYEIGSTFLRSRNYTEAVTALERAAELRPDHIDTWLKLGIARSALKEWDGATSAYTRVLEIDPDHAKAYHNLGNVEYRRGDFEKAAEGYGRALEIDPQYLLAAFHYGWTLRQINRPKEAERVFRQCLEIPATDPRAMQTHVDCLFGLGSIRHRAGDYESSAKMMERVVSVNPGHPEARYYLGIAYRQLGRTEDAERQLEIHRKMLSARRTPMVPAFDEPTDP